jgi:hypothetical protein
LIHILTYIQYICIQIIYIYICNWVLTVKHCPPVIEHGNWKSFMSRWCSRWNLHVQRVCMLAMFDCDRVSVIQVFYNLV